MTLGYLMNREQSEVINWNHRGEQAQLCFCLSIIALPISSFSISQYNKTWKHTIIKLFALSGRKGQLSSLIGPFSSTFSGFKLLCHFGIISTQSFHLILSVIHEPIGYWMLLLMPFKAAIFTLFLLTLNRQKENMQYSLRYLPLPTPASRRCCYVNMLHYISNWFLFI